MGGTPETNTGPVVDLEAVRKEVGALSPEELREQLLSIRVRQKVQQKKYQSPERQKAYQMKVRERNRLLKARALELGIYEQINEAAEKQAELKLAEDTSAEEPEA